MIALDGIDFNWLARRGLAPAARDSARFLTVGTFCDEIVVVGTFSFGMVESVANELIGIPCTRSRVLGAPYLDFEMWAFARKREPLIPAESIPSPPDDPPSVPQSSASSRVL